MSLCMGSTRCVLARQPEVSVASPLVQRPFSPPRRAAQVARSSGGLSPVAGAFSLPGQWLRQPEVCARSPQVRRAFSLCGEWPGQPGACAPSPPGAVGLFPPGPRRVPPVGSREFFRQEPGPVCRVGGGGFSGAEFAPFPSPLPPSSSGDGPALLCSFSVPLFCEPPAVCSSRLIFPCSTTV